VSTLVVYKAPVTASLTVQLFDTSSADKIEENEAIVAAVSILLIYALSSYKND